MSHFKQRILVTLTLALAALPSLGITAGQEKLPFEDEIKAFEAQDAKKMPPQGGILFVGSSSIRLWKTLAQDFPKHPVINRGFGGSAISDSIRYTPRIVLPYKPKMIFFFAGTNDIASGKTPETVFNDWKTFVAGVKEKLPQTKIAYLALTPAPSRWNKIAEVKKTNELIRDWCLVTPGLIFVETFPYFTTSDGGPRPDLFVSDQLHLNEKGYDIWRKLVAPLLPWSLKDIKNPR